MRRREDQFDYALVTLVFKSGAVANLEGYYGYPGEFRTAAEFAGTKGVIRSDSTKAKSVQVRKIREIEEGARFVEVPGSPLINAPYFIELEHFMNCIRENLEPIVSARDACLALEIASAAQESTITGKAILF
nr:Gfo/Idh/MocA family oxidoreductase [Paenibacillus nasutitermitis]